MNTAMINTATDTEARAAKKTAEEAAQRQRLADEKQKQRDAAEELYWDILCNPKRTAEADKKDFEAARSTLGKTAEDVRDDVELVVKIHTADEAVDEVEQAHKKFTKAHNEWDQWTSGGAASGRNKALAAVHENTKALEKAKEDASNLLREWQGESHRRANCRDENPHIVCRLKPAN